MPSEYLPLIPDSSLAEEIPTFKDLVDLCTLYQSSQSDARRTELAKRAVFTAYREAMASHPWRFLKRVCTITTSADVSITGTVYTASTRTFALTGAPSWARDGNVQIESGSYEGEYEIQDVASDGTTITLRRESSISDDIASVDIVVARRRYPLPIDFRADRTVFDQKDQRALARFVQAREHLLSPASRRSPDSPMAYFIRPGRSALGKWIELTPPPTDARVISIAYQSQGRPLLMYETTGTVTGTSGSNAVTFASAPSSNCVGCVLRIRSSDSSTPTSLSGSTPWEQQRILTALSGTSGTLDADLDSDVTAAACVLSDPLDIDSTVLLPYLEMQALYKLGQLTRSDDAAKIKVSDLRKAYIDACERDADVSYSDIDLSGWYDFATMNYEDYAS